MRTSIDLLPDATPDLLLNADDMGADNPRAELKRTVAQIALLLSHLISWSAQTNAGYRMAARIGHAFRRLPASVSAIAASLRALACLATRRKSLKRALVCTIAFVIFAQPNLALAAILMQPAAQQLTLKRRIEHPLNSAHPTKLIWTRLASVASMIGSTAISATVRARIFVEDAVKLVLPLDEEVFPHPIRSPETHQPLRSLNPSVPSRPESPFDPLVLGVEPLGPDSLPGFTQVEINGFGFQPGASVSLDGKPIITLRGTDKYRTTAFTRDGDARMSEQSKASNRSLPNSLPPEGGTTNTAGTAKLIDGTTNLIALAPVSVESLQSASHLITVANPNGRMARFVTNGQRSSGGSRGEASKVSFALSAFPRLALFSPAYLIFDAPVAGSPSIVASSYAQAGVVNLPVVAVSKQVPSLNGGRIEGTLRVFEGASWTITSGLELTSDLFVPGTPAIHLNGNARYGGTVDGGGAATPSGYTITLNGNVNLPGKIHIHSDPISLPSDIPSSVQPPTGTRSVDINSAADAAAVGDWTTVRDLTVNGSNLSVDVPPGRYGQFTVNGNSRLNFSGGDYSFAGQIIVNGNSSIQAIGSVSITTAQNLNINGGSFIQLGPNTLPGSVRLNAIGTQLTLNGNASIAALVRAPNAQVTLNGNAEIRGQVIANKLVMNGNARILGDLAAPAVDISSPANNSTTASDRILISGHASDTGVNATGIAHVFVNNIEAVYSPSAGTWAIANFPLAVGQNSITARAVDAVGNEATAEITVTREQPAQDTAPPQLAITSPANNSETQASSISVSGTVSDPSPNASGIASLKVNNIDATRDVLAGTWTVASTPLTIGPNTITARAVDNAGNASTATITVNRRELPPEDATPPAVTITSPADNSVTFDSSITVTGTAADSGPGATGVSKVFVNGVEATYDSGSHNWTATGVSLSDGDNRIVAEALDNATPMPNRGSTEIHVRRRVVAPPQVTISNPNDGAVVSASSLTIAGTVTSGASDVSVAVKVNDQDASVAGGQYTRTISLVDGPNQVTVRATDALNQTAQASLTVVHDGRPPSVVISNAPATVLSGATYEIRADASDDLGVADVDFSVDGQLISSDTISPYGFTLAVPATAQPDQIITITATARDQAGLTSTDTVRARVSGPGGVSGYAFDDATGFGIEGVALLGGAGPIGTDHTGAFNFVSSATAGLVRFAKTGYTPVERAFSVASGRGISLFDARLTAASSVANNISPTGGTATGDNGRLQVTFPANALASATDIRVTPISPQGLINLLPFGWSPVPGAVVDIRADDSSAPSASSIHLSITQVTGLLQGTQLVLASYNESGHQWIAVNSGLTAGANGAVEADLASLGQYAFLVADTGSTAPPTAVVGHPLLGSAPAESSVLDTAVTVASAIADPRTALISPEARSTITFVATGSSNLPSGVAIEATFDETYNLLSDANPLLVDRPAQDFVLYSYPAATGDDPNRLGAFFIAKPTRGDFTVAQLRTGNVHVEIRSGRGSGGGGVLIGTNGGEVSIDSGAKLEIPAGAFTSSLPVFLENVPPDLAGLTLPTGYEIVGAIDVDVSTVTLASSATLSIPSVAGDLSRIVVARLVTAAGRRSPKVVARGVDATGRLRSVTTGAPVPSGITLSGINVSGRYVFIRVPSPFGYIKGVVSLAAGQPSSIVGPASAVRVGTDLTPFVDITSGDGRYVIIGSASVVSPPSSGANAVDALSLTSDATGTASAVLSAQDSVADAPITVASIALAVSSVSPGDNASSVVVTSPITVTFTKPVSAASLTGSTFKLTTSSGNPVLGAITLLAGNRVASFTPASNLAGSTSYRVTLTTSVLDIYGNALGSQFSSSFTTAATVTTDNRLKPERIGISYPNSTGFVTITIPAGAVPIGSVIIVINNTSGSTITTVEG